MVTGGCVVISRFRVVRACADAAIDAQAEMDARGSLGNVLPERRKPIMQRSARLIRNNDEGWGLFRRRVVDALDSSWRNYGRRGLVGDELW